MENTKLLEQAQQLVEENPDSALVLLRSVNTGLLDDERYYHYILLEVRAKDKAGESISGDTARLKRVCDYYRDHKKYNKFSFACFNLGQAYATDNPDKSAKAYKTALTYIDYIDNPKLKGLINYNTGGVNYETGHYQEALDYYRNALVCFQSPDDYFYLGDTYLMLGCTHIFLENTDSAMYYFKQAERIAEDNNDKSLKIRILHDMAEVYLRKEDLKNAFACSFQVAALQPEDPVNNYLLLAELHLTIGEADSARCYVDKVLPFLNDSSDYRHAVLAYYYLSEVERMTGNMISAFKYRNQYDSFIEKFYEEAINKSVLEIQKRYDYETVQNENNRLTIQKQQIILWGSVLIIVFIFVMFMLYRRHKRMQNKYLYACNDLSTLQKINRKLNERLTIIEENRDQKEPGHVEQWRKQVQNSIELIKDMANLNEYLNSESEGGRNMLVLEVKKTLNKINPEKIMEIVDCLYPGYPEKLKNTCYQLDHMEICVCCLTHAGFSISEIAGILKVKPNTVMKRRTKIREKTGRKDIEDFLQSLS